MIKQLAGPATAAILGNAILSAAVHAADRPTFDLPINCNTAPACLLQSMVDMDSGPGHKDPFCGHATYDGHKGTDIRVRSLADLRRGVAVLAIADGIVLRTRNTMADRLLQTSEDRQKVAKTECGNGVVIDHGVFNGARWTSQVCHLGLNKVSVAPGDKVKRGQKLGLMGLSGLTQFPHVHLTIQRNKDVIDPMSGKTMGQKCGAGTQKSLWSKKALQALSTHDSPLINAGFAGTPVSAVQVMINKVPKPEKTGALVFYSVLKNLRKGDKVQLIIDRDGEVFARQTTKPLDRPKARYIAYAGKRRRPMGGTYSGSASIIRDGRIVFKTKTFIGTF